MSGWQIAQTLSVALIAAGVAYGATPLAGRLAGILGMQDRPSGRKIHVRVVPYLGGLGILAGWLVVFLRPDTFRESLSLLVGMAALGILGFIDDRREVDERLKLGIQVCVALAAFAGGIRLTPFDNLGLQFPLIGVADLAVTTFWIVGITNAFNFMDNMDGLAAGVGAIGAASLGVVGILFGQQLVSLLGFALAGACIGFLRHNFHPARIFMGDVGSMPLGFGLAVLAVKMEFPGLSPLIAFSIPVTILALFIIDATVMLVGRLVRGEALIGGRLDHLSHRLLHRGIRVKHVAALLYSVAAIFGLAGIVASKLSPAQATWILSGSFGCGAWLTVAALQWEPLRRPSQMETEPDPAVTIAA